MKGVGAPRQEGSGAVPLLPPAGASAGAGKCAAVASPCNGTPLTESCSQACDREAPAAEWAVTHTKVRSAHTDQLGDPQTQIDFQLGTLVRGAGEKLLQLIRTDALFGGIYCLTDGNAGFLKKGVGALTADSALAVVLPVDFVWPGVVLVG